MEAPKKTSGRLYANDAHDLSTAFAPLLPSHVQDVGPFLSEVGYALGKRDADLALELGVSRATLSGWKKRGIPTSYLEWFSGEFPVIVLTSRTPRYHDDLRSAGIELVLALFRRTSFNPFQVEGLDERQSLDLCYMFFSGLCRLALFTMHRSSDVLDAKGEPLDAMLERFAPLVKAAGSEMEPMRR